MSDILGPVGVVQIKIAVTFSLIISDNFYGGFFDMELLKSQETAELQGLLFSFRDGSFVDFPFPHHLPPSTT